jgi:hypothetical protein
MKNHYLTRSLVVLVGALAVLLGSCDPEETVSSTANSSEPEAVIPEQSATASSAGDELAIANSNGQLTANVQSQNFEISHYSNDEWAIAVVDSGDTATPNLTYYACDQGNVNCLELTGGTMECGGDVCIYDWLNGNFRYSLEISEYAKVLQVYENDSLILESSDLVQDYAQFYDDDVDLVPQDRENVAGISEAQLKELLPKIQKAVFTENWQTLADMSADSVNVKFSMDEDITPIPKASLATTLAEQDLGTWKIRVMTQNFDDLFLNQYGAMIGQGSIWIGSKAMEDPAQIITINIW